MSDPAASLWLPQEPEPVPDLPDDLFGDPTMFDSLMEGDDMLDPMFTSYAGSLTLTPELCHESALNEHDPMLAAFLAMEDSLGSNDIPMA